MLGPVPSSLPKTAVPLFDTYTPYIPSERLPVAVSVPSSIVSLPPATSIRAFPSNVAPWAGPVIFPFPVIVRSPAAVISNSAGDLEEISLPSRSSVIFLSTVMLSIAVSFSSLTVSPAAAALTASASVV